MKPILQNDIFCQGRINVFSPESGDIIGWVSPELKAITIEGANPDFVFNNLQAAVKCNTAEDKRNKTGK